MRALLLKLFQETACYKKPFAFKVGETYPLPPYSTVKGMIHALVDANDFIPMRLSIQGNYDTIMIDYQSHYFFKKTNVNEIPLVLDGLTQKAEYKNMTTMPLYVHMLYNVELLIHVEVEEIIMDKIIEAIENKGQHLSLGRWEDIIRVDEYKIVEVQRLEYDEELELKYNAYIPDSKLSEEIISVPYRLNWKYEIKNGVRQWEKIKTGYVQAGDTLYGEGLLIDDKGNPVIYHLDR